MQELCQETGKVRFQSRQAARRARSRNARSGGYHAELHTYCYTSCRDSHNGHPLNWRNHKKFKRIRIRDMEFISGGVMDEDDAVEAQGGIA